MYLAGCELHIQTLPFLVLTLKQYVDAKTIWRSEVWNINHHDDYCQPLVTYAALIQPTLKVFLGKQVVLEPSLYFTPGLQSLVCILFLVWSWQSAFYTDSISKQIEIFPKQVWIRSSVELGGNWEKPCSA